MSVSQSSSSVVFDGAGKPAGERNVDQSVSVRDTRNTYSAHSKFSENTQAEKMVDRTGKLVGESSSNAQIRTLLDEQRQIIITEYCEKIGHHELQAAHAVTTPTTSTPPSHSSDLPFHPNKNPDRMDSATWTGRSSGRRATDWPTQLRRELASLTWAQARPS